LPIRLPLTPVEEAERSLLRQTVRRRLERLPERERLIVERRFGLQGEPQSLETVGRPTDPSAEMRAHLQLNAAARATRNPDLRGFKTQLPALHAADGGCGVR
jgi:RNA polymerase primary sigma factor